MNYIHFSNQNKRKDIKRRIVITLLVLIFNTVPDLASTRLYMNFVRLNHTTNISSSRKQSKMDKKIKEFMEHKWLCCQATKQCIYYINVKSI